MTTIPVPSVHIQSGCVLLDIPRLGLPPSLELFGKRWVAKEENHVTLVGRGHEAVKKIMAWPERPSGADADVFFQAAAESVSRDISFAVVLEKRLYQVSRGNACSRDNPRHTIIATCKVIGVERFYSILAAQTGIEFQPVPHHVTLYTQDDPASRRGIGLTTRSDLEIFGYRIPSNRYPRAFKKLFSR